MVSQSSGGSSDNAPTVAALETQLAKIAARAGTLTNEAARQNLMESCEACRQQLAQTRKKESAEQMRSLRAVRSGLLHLEHAIAIVLHGARSAEANAVAARLHAMRDQPGENAGNGEKASA
jgi:hypothetical protein